jgi:hypothetical protein
MLRNWKKLLVGACVLVITPWASSFTLLGPGGAEGATVKDWQLPAANDGWTIGYNLASDIGAPVALGEFYRWNTPVITYAFDSAFVFYFGTNGMKAVDAAIRMLNEVPHTSKMSEDLSEFPLNAVQVHPEAAQLGLVDLKSHALQMLMESIGLADPIRWNYSIRHRENIPPSNFGIYDITRFNYDPVTLSPSSYVNGTLWTYEIFESIPTQTSEAIEVRPPALNNEPINYPVTALSHIPIFSGTYFTSLTRDDIGGIRYLLRPKTKANEALLPDVTASGGKWSPYLGTNTLTNAIGGGTGTNGSAGLRGGIGKLRFRKVYFNSLLGQLFNPQTYRYRDTFITTNGLSLSQSVQRQIVVPDIIFSASDLYPFLSFRTDTSGWINNETLNTAPNAFLRGGPGVISPPIVITFDNSPRLLRNITPFFVTEPFITDTNARNNFLINSTFASFDGTTNPPVIYPAHLNYSIQTIRAVVGGNP